MIGRMNIGHDYSRTMAVQTIPIDQKEEFLQALEPIDVIVHQPIGNAFVMSTDEIKATFAAKRFVSFPSIHFRGFAPHLTGFKHPDKGVISGPLKSYHDSRIIRCFLNGKSSVECLNDMQLPDDHIITSFE